MEHAQPIELHPAHLLGIRGTKVREVFGSEKLKRGLERLAFDVKHMPLQPLPDPRALGELLMKDMDIDE